jgi:hypothetical protein
MSKHAALLGAIVITTANNTIKMVENATTQNVTIAPGTYYLRNDGTADDFGPALVTALNSNANAVNPNTYSTNISYLISPSGQTASFQITSTAASAYQLQFADPATTFDATLLGFPQTNTALNALPKTGSLSPSALWVSPDVFAFSEPVDEYDVAIQRARSGRVYGLRKGGPYDVRLLSFMNLDSRRVLDWDNTSDPNATIMRFLQRHGNGLKFELHAVTASNGVVLDPLSSSTRVGTAWHFAQEASERFAPQRINAGIALYSFDLKLHGYVA